MYVNGRSLEGREGSRKESEKPSVNKQPFPLVNTWLFILAVQLDYERGFFSDY